MLTFADVQLRDFARRNETWSTTRRAHVASESVGDELIKMATVFNELVEGWIAFKFPDSERLSACQERGQNGSRSGIRCSSGGVGS